MFIRQEVFNSREKARIKITPEGMYFDQASLKMVSGDTLKIIFIIKNHQLEIRAGKEELMSRGMFVPVSFFCEMVYGILCWDKNFSYICFPKRCGGGLIVMMDDFARGYGYEKSSKIQAAVKECQAPDGYGEGRGMRIWPV